MLTEKATTEQLPRTLELDLVLDNQGVTLVVDDLGEFGRDGMVGSLVLEDESFVAFHALEHRRLFHRPGTDVGPFLVVSLDVLLCVRRLPPAFPVVCELFEERGLEVGGLACTLVCIGMVSVSVRVTYGKCWLSYRGRSR